MGFYVIEFRNSHQRRLHPVYARSHSRRSVVVSTERLNKVAAGSITATAYVGAHAAMLLSHNRTWLRGCRRYEHVAQRGEVSSPSRVTHPGDKRQPKSSNPVGRAGKFTTGVDGRAVRC